MEHIHVDGNLFREFLEEVYLYRLMTHHDEIQEIISEQLDNLSEYATFEELVGTVQKICKERFYPKGGLGGMFDET